jgi:hypothetical protein
MRMKLTVYRFAKRGIGGCKPHAHEAKQCTALQSEGLGVANPRKMLLFWFFCLDFVHFLLRSSNALVSRRNVTACSLATKPRTRLEWGVWGTRFPHTPASDTH